MSDLTDIRVIEACGGGWIVQYQGGFGWTQLGDETFSTQSEAEAFMDDQVESADFDGEE